jgi:tetratricopeptide (TPR) repeat protein
LAPVIAPSAKHLELPSTQTQSAETQASQKQAEVERLRAQVRSLYGEGKFDEALPLATRLLELSESAFGPGNAEVANAATNLAAIYIAKGKNEKAEPLLWRAIEINDKVRQPADPVVVKTLEMYTCVLHRTEQDDKLKTFDKDRSPLLNASAEPDRFWGALWRATKVISIPQPEYPPAAKGVASGRILVEVTVDEEGKVIRAQSMCGGSVLLIKVSEDAARKAQFKPIVIAGKPVRIIGYLLYRFVRQ